MSSTSGMVHFPPNLNFHARSSGDDPSGTSTPRRQTPPNVSPGLYVSMALTPSPTRSDASTELFGGQSDSPTSPTTTGVPTKVAVHLTLASVKHADPAERPFIWDLTTHPNKIRGPKIYGPALPSPYIIPRELRSQPALTPIQTRITISCQRLPWKIKVEAPEDQPYVTVEHVLQSIYSFLRLSVQEAELHSLPGWGPRSELETQVTEAYNLRLAHVPEADRPREEARGIRRVDLLTDTTQFAGLSPGAEEDQLFMHIVPLAP